jgi:glycyl-tRNA synthetase beta chain
VDRFFTDVMVNAEDQKVRENRLRLLSELSALLNLVADISKLAA